MTTVNNTTFGPTGLLLITTAITIQGNGATIRRAVLTAPEFRIFAVDIGGQLTLQQTTVSGGNISTNDKGGGVSNNGILRLINSTIAGNEAYDGGGVYNHGTFTMTGSTISGNTADLGGGVDNASASAQLTVLNSTISENTATEDGGGVRINSGTLTLDSGGIDTAAACESRLNIP